MSHTPAIRAYIAKHPDCTAEELARAIWPQTTRFGEGPGWSKAVEAARAILARERRVA